MTTKGLVAHSFVSLIFFILATVFFQMVYGDPALSIKYGLYVLGVNLVCIPVSNSMERVGYRIGNKLLRFLYYTGFVPIAAAFMSGMFIFIITFIGSGTINLNAFNLSLGVALSFKYIIMGGVSILCFHVIASLISTRHEH